MKSLFKNILVLIMMITLLPCNSLIAQEIRSTRHVMIDPAHGGTDTGVKISDGYYEKDITFAIATLIKKELEKTGNIKVDLTRNSDIEISLSERIKAVKSSNRDAFIVIHVNAGFGKDSSGYELYFPGFASVTAGQVNPKDIIEDMAKNKHLNDSVRLAQLIQRNLEGVFPRKSRGLRSAPFYILNSLPLASVIVEIGFSTNSDDRKKILDEKVKIAVARALSNSIREFF